MNGVMIDAEALKEFLDKAEPFIPEDAFGSWAEQLDQRLRSADRQFGLVQQSGGDPEKLPWHLIPATRRLPAAERERGAERAYALARLAESGNGQQFWELVDSWEERPKWALEWATYWFYLANPERAPWWARWLYNPGNQTGAFVLLLDDPRVMEPRVPPSQQYGQIAQGMGLLGAVLESIHRLPRVPDSHRPLICLSLVYAVYMFTVTSWRMTTEFTQVLPPFARVVEGLLGIRHGEGVQLEQRESQKL
ncbi:MAG: hypothetical protein K6T64_03470 [Kyrpidia sp.]|nr:hypothetical protein [Kyrpidia sp.]HHY68086.1 hypothetical protein [Alicyclobacillus sp.]